MYPKNTFYYHLLLLLCFVSFGQQTPLIPADSSLVSSSETKTAFEDSLIMDKSSLHIVPTQKKDYPLNYKSYRRLGYNTALYIGFAALTFGVVWIMPENATNWNKQEIKEQGFFYQWSENVQAGPKMDENSLFINYVTHPYSGGIYYMTARSSGFNIFESFAFSALLSTFYWEYGIEAFAEIPSTQDLIITPVLGSLVGEGFFYAKKSILKNDKKILNSRFLGTTTLFLIDPSNSLLDALGYKDKIKTQMKIAMVGFNPITNTMVWGVDFSANF